MKTKLYNLYPGQKFTWNGVRYTVTSQEVGMAEVFDNTRYWAWNSSATVTYHT